MSTHHTFTIAVASGKGGTGKTMVATGLAALLAENGSRVALADCDVDAPNAHLFLAPENSETRPVEALIAAVDTNLCTACGACRDVCAFGAVRVLGSSAMVFDELCHGCGLCTAVCPTGAISEIARRVGEIEIGQVAGRAGLTIVTGRLDIGQVKSPTVIRAARDAARELDAEYVVLDAPPGVACATVAAVKDADALLLVTEPTPFGLHDLELSVRLGRNMALPMAVVVNRVQGDAESVENACARWGIPVVAQIPFEREIAETYATGGLSTDSMASVRSPLEQVAANARRMARRPAGVIA